jgi:hypothetical protein
LQLGDRARRADEHAEPVVAEHDADVQRDRSGTAITDTTTFHHAMAVFDGSVMRLFLDGTLAATSGATTLQPSPNDRSRSP